LVDQEVDLSDHLLQTQTLWSKSDEGAQSWVLTGLRPPPQEEWERLRDFSGPTPADREAMLQTVEALFRRGPELVAGNYDYLLHNHETAAILGWEKGADETHLAERRRFFTVWLARTLSLDLGTDFASYLFRAGQIHAAHGPRQIHVPEVYVTGAISLVNSTFARFLQEELPHDPIVPEALAGWNKYLAMHLHMMLSGYRTAVDLDRGEFTVPVHFFGRLRELLARQRLEMGCSHQQTIAAALRKLFDYYPQLRPEVFDPAWETGERLDATGTPWLTVQKAGRVRPGWRLLRNGREVAYSGGLGQVLQAGDELQFFPPGR
jgi:molybdopterin converting factor small subunit